MTRQSDTDLNGREPRAEALPILVEAHGGRLYPLGLRFCGHREEAEDLVEETVCTRRWASRTVRLIQ